MTNHHKAKGSQMLSGLRPVTTKFSSGDQYCSEQPKRVCSALPHSMGAELQDDHQDDHQKHHKDNRPTHHLPGAALMPTSSNQLGDCSGLVLARLLDVRLDVVNVRPLFRDKGIEVLRPTESRRCQRRGKTKHGDYGEGKKGLCVEEG